MKKLLVVSGVARDHHWPCADSVACAAGIAAHRRGARYGREAGPGAHRRGGPAGAGHRLLAGAQRCPQQRRARVGRRDVVLRRGSGCGARVCGPGLEAVWRWPLAGGSASPRFGRLVHRCLSARARLAQRNEHIMQQPVEHPSEIRRSKPSENSSNSPHRSSPMPGRGYFVGIGRRGELARPSVPARVLDPIAGALGRPSPADSSPR